MLIVAEQLSYPWKISMVNIIFQHRWRHLVSTAGLLVLETETLFAFHLRKVSLSKERYNISNIELKAFLMIIFIVGKRTTVNCSI
jgi:hypothetical protein